MPNTPKFSKVYEHGGKKHPKNKSKKLFKSFFFFFGLLVKVKLNCYSGEENRNSVLNTFQDTESETRKLP